MADKYCYQDSTVLINKLNIRDQQTLFEAEKRLAFVRLFELQKDPIKGRFDFGHLKAIHKHIFQDLYEWAGQTRTVDISKGNLFCTVPCIPGFAQSVFENYYPQCHAARNNPEKFVKALAENYGELNALHPFREGNGRSQREFARNVCLSCGYDFDLSYTTHKEMLEASKLSFDKGDNSGFEKIFSRVVVPHKEKTLEEDRIIILTSDDLTREEYRELKNETLNTMGNVLESAKKTLQDNRLRISEQAKEEKETENIR